MTISKKEIFILIAFIITYEVLQLFSASFIFSYNTSFFGISHGWKRAWDIKLMMLSALVLFPATFFISRKWEYTTLVLLVFACLIPFFGCVTLYSDTWSLRTEYSGWDRMGTSYIVNKTATHLFNYLLFLTATMLVSLRAIGKLKQILLYVIPLLVYFVVLILTSNNAPSYLG